MEHERIYSVETRKLAESDPTEIIDTVRDMLGPAGDRLLELSEADIEGILQTGTCSPETMDYLRGIGQLIDVWRVQHPGMDTMQSRDLRPDLKPV